MSDQTIQARRKQILLDLGGVVFNSTGTSNTIIDWESITILNHKYGHQLNVGEDLFGRFMEEYNRMTQQSITGPTFLKAVFDTLEINADLIKGLQNAGCTIHILSDNYRENIEYIAQRYRFATWAERQFYSYQFGLTKEDPELFNLVMQALDKRPEELLLIDDSPHKLATAASCGIQGILYRNTADVLQQLP